MTKVNARWGRLARRRTATTLLAAVLGITGAAALPASPAAAAPPPVLRLVQTGVDFDAAPMGGSAKRVITLVNDGPGTATGVRASLVGTARFSFESNTCGLSNSGGGTLAPGAACTITVNYEPFTPARRSGSLRVTAAGGSTDTTWLSGTGAYDEPGLRITPSSLDFGRVPVGGVSVTQSVTVTNQGTAPRPVHVEGTLPAAPFEISHSSCTSSVQILAPGASCSIFYRFRPTAATEAYWFNDMVVRTAPEGHRHPMGLELRGRGGNPAAEPLRITPRRLDFGDVPMGGTTTAGTVFITNTTDAAVSFTLAGGGAGVFGGTNSCTGTLAPGAACFLSYQPTPPHSGTFVGWTSLDLTVGSRTQRAEIDFVGRGVGAGSPLLTSSAQRINLGSGTAPNSTTFTVGNYGSAPLTGMAVTRVDVPASISTSHTCPVTLNAGQSCSVTATYSPTSPPTASTWSELRIGSASNSFKVTLTTKPTASVHQRFVRFAHIMFLDREATGAEVSSQAGALDAGTRSRASVISALAGSTEWVRTIVARMYLDTLGRPGEAAGVAYWTEEIRSGRRSVAQVAGSFYASPEYFNGIGGGTVNSWLSDLYLKLLKRSATPADLTYWSGEVARTGRTPVAIRMFQSNESARTRVTELYQRLLFRNPDAAGRDFWVPRVIRDGDVVLAVNLASSEEFLRLAQYGYEGG